MCGTRLAGCSKVSQGCKNCYAERVFSRPYPGRKFTDVRMHEGRVDQPLRRRKPRKIFVNSMSDLFHESVTDNFLDKCFAVMALAQRHTFQILTKRPERMLQYFNRGGIREIRNDKLGYKVCLAFSPGEFQYTTTSLRTNANGCSFPLPNVWLGVSVEDQATADERIPLLLQTPAAVRWVSYEPALRPVDFFRWLEPFKDTDAMSNPAAKIDWIVAGGESGPKARPSDLAWYRSARDQCKAAGVPFFMKQLGNFPESYQKEPFPFEQLYERPVTSQDCAPSGVWALADRGAHGDPMQWPEDLRVREYPS